MALSLLPFLAQGRALYIVLVYHTNSPEVVGSLLLLFGVGSITLIIAFLVDEHGSIVPGIAKLLGRAPVLDAVNLDEADDAEDNHHNHDNKQKAGVKIQEDGVEINIMRSLDSKVNEEVDSALLAAQDIRRELDEDLRREKNRARLYVKAKSAATRAGLINNHQMNAAEAVESGEVLSQEEQDRLAIVLHGMKFCFPTGGSVGDLCGKAPSAANARDPTVWAVNGMSLALSLGECFGLLGPNGAGSSFALIAVSELFTNRCSCSE